MLKLQLWIGIGFFVGILHASGLVELPYLSSEVPVAEGIADLDANEMSEEVLVAKVQLKATSDANQMVSSFVGQVNGTGLNGVLEPRRIVNDPNLRESTAVLHRVKDLIAHFEEINYDRINALRDDIDQLDVDQNTKDDMMTNVNFHYGGGGEFRQLLKAQDKLVDSVSSVLDVLRQTGGRWSYQSNQLKFERMSDQQAFDSRLSQVNQARQQVARSIRRGQ